MARPDTETNLSGRLEQARGELSQAERALLAHPPELGELHAVVDGAMQVTTALAELVATVMRQAPVTLRGHHHEKVLGELLADLRAMHGCLTTGPLLLAPARDDLRHLLSGTDRAGNGFRGEPETLDDRPAHDLADQQCPAPHDPADSLGEPDAEEIEFDGALEAAPADVADQPPRPISDPDAAGESR